MTSAINPNNIDGTFPVAGQDNDSQGFRDNFTNTKNNFSAAATEITELQQKAVLKAPLSGDNISGTYTNDMAGTIMTNVQLQDTSLSRVFWSQPVSGAVTLNYSTGQYQVLQTGGAVTFGFSNWPETGRLGTLTVEVTVSDASHTVTVPSTVGASSATWSTATSTQHIQGWNNNVISFASTGTYVFKFTTTDGGITVFIEDLTRTSSYSGSESLTNGAASLSKSVSYFSTTQAETATLAAGVAGQIKTFAMYADGGDMVITVTNAGWKTSGTGTVTFNTIGESCTLQYINNKWFCISNNGATFA